MDNQKDEFNPVDLGLILDRKKYNKEVDKYIEKTLADSISHLRACLIYHSHKRTYSSKEYKEKERESKSIQGVLNSLITLDQRLIYGIKKS